MRKITGTGGKASGAASSGAKNKIKVKFEITLIQLNNVPNKCNEKYVFIAWKRGAKKMNRGESKRVKVQAGAATFCAIQNLNSNASVPADAQIILGCTMVQFERLNRWEEKTLQMSLTEEQGKKSAELAKLDLNLAEFALNGTNVTREFKFESKTKTSGTPPGIKVRIKSEWLKVNNKKLVKKAGATATAGSDGSIAKLEDDYDLVTEDATDNSETTANDGSDENEFSDSDWEIDDIKAESPATKEEKLSTPVKSATTPFAATQSGTTPTSAGAGGLSASAQEAQHLGERLKGSSAELVKMKDRYNKMEKKKKETSQKLKATKKELALREEEIVNLKGALKKGQEDLMKKIQAENDAFKSDLAATKKLLEETRLHNERLEKEKGQNIDREIESEKERLAQVDKQIADQQELKKLKTSMLQKTEELDRFALTAKQKDSQLKDEQAKNEQLTRQIAENSRKAEERIAKLKADIANREEETNKMRAAGLAVQETAQFAQAELEEQKKKNSVMEAELSKLKADAEQAEKALKAERQTTSQLNATIADMKKDQGAKGDSLQRDLAKAREEVAKTKQAASEQVLAAEKARDAALLTVDEKTKLLKSAESALEDLRKKLTNQEQQTSAVQQQVASLERNLKAAQAELESAHKAISEKTESENSTKRGLESKQREAANENEKLVLELEKLRKSEAKVKEEVHSLSDKLANEVRKHQDSVASLKLEVKAAENNASQAKSALAKAQGENADLVKESAKLKEQIDVRKSEASKAGATDEQASRASEEKATQLENQAQRLKKLVAAKDDEIEQIAGRLSKEHEKNQELNDMMEKDAQKTSAALKEAEDSVRELRLQVLVMERIIQELQEFRQETQKDRAGLVAELEEARSLVESKTNEVDSLRDAVKSGGGQMDQLKRTLQNLEAANADLAKLRSKNQELEESVKRLEKQQTEDKRQREALMAAQSKSEDEIKNYFRERQDAQATIARLQANLAQLTDTSKESEETADILRKEIKELRSQQKASSNNSASQNGSEEVATLQRKLEKLKETKEELLHQVSREGKQAKKFKGQVEKKDNKLTKVKERLSKKQDKVAKLKERLQKAQNSQLIDGGNASQDTSQVQELLEKLAEKDAELSKLSQQVESSEHHEGHGLPMSIELIELKIVDKGVYKAELRNGEHEEAARELFSALCDHGVFKAGLADSPLLNRVAKTLQNCIKIIKGATPACSVGWLGFIAALQHFIVDKYYHDDVNDFDPAHAGILLYPLDIEADDTLNKFLLELQPLLLQLYQDILKTLYERIGPLLVPALLQTPPSPAVSSRSERSRAIRASALGSCLKSPADIMAVLDQTIKVFIEYKIYAPITKQFFVQVFYWIDTHLFNHLMNGTMLCTYRNGFQLKKAMAELLAWVPKNAAALQTGRTKAQCDPVLDAATVLTMDKSFFGNERDVREAFPSLHPTQIMQMFNSYESDEQSREPVSREARDTLSRMTVTSPRMSNLEKDQDLLLPYRP